MQFHDIQTKLVTQVENKSGNWPNDIDALKTSPSLYRLQKQICANSKDYTNRGSNESTEMEITLGFIVTRNAASKYLY